MTFLMALLFSISCNLDNVVFGMTYGISKVKISFKKSVIISLICTTITIYCLIIGKAISDFIPIVLSNIIGASSLVFLGIYFIFKDINNKDSNTIKYLNIKNIIYIALSLSFNNMPIALASSIGGIDILLTSIISFIFSSFFIYIGNIIGERVNGKYFSFLASILLIFLGIVSLIL